jgi:hypothetical protein
MLQFVVKIAPKAMTQKHLSDHGKAHKKLTAALPGRGLGVTPQVSEGAGIFALCEYFFLQSCATELHPHPQNVAFYWASSQLKEKSKKKGTDSIVCFFYCTVLPVNLAVKSPFQQTRTGCRHSFRTGREADSRVMGCDTVQVPGRGCPS